MKKIFLILLIVICIPIPAVAQNTDLQQLSVRGLEITPFLLDLEVEKGGQIKSQIDLTNRTASPLIITVTPRDFLPGLEGQPEFVPDVQINDPTFSLASWVKLEKETQFTIQSNETVTVPFTLSPPANAEDGTHYGALLFSYVGSSATGSASEIQQSVGSIILVQYGVGREVGETKLATSRKLMFSADRSVLENKFTNTGNVHLKPKGEIFVRNIFGKIVSTPFVNRDAANVLPKTDRTFVNTWYPSSFSFGRYTAESVLIYGRGRLEAKDKVVIWVLPWYLLIFVGLIISAILWFFLHGRHWHKRRVIDRHYQSLKN